MDGPVKAIACDQRRDQAAVPGRQTYQRFEANQALIGHTEERLIVQNKFIMEDAHRVAFYPTPCGPAPRHPFRAQRSGCNCDHRPCFCRAPDLRSSKAARGLSRLMVPAKVRRSRWQRFHSLRILLAPSAQRRAVARRRRPGRGQGAIRLLLMTRSGRCSVWPVATEIEFLTRRSRDRRGQLATLTNPPNTSAAAQQAIRRPRSRALGKSGIARAQGRNPRRRQCLRRG